MSETVSAMERMSPLDWLFLGVETRVSHMHLGSVAVFEGPVPSYGELAAVVAARLPALARYRQRVRSVPLDLGRPVWVNDPGFELGYHVRHTALPRPGGDAELERLIAQVMAIPLDRGRPLWEMWLIGGLADERWGLLCKLHHCMVDGLAASDLLAVLLNIEPHDVPQLDDRWVPSPAPSTTHVLAHALRDHALNPLAHVRTAATLARNPHRLARTAAAVAAGVLSLRGPAGTPITRSLNRPLSRHRQWMGVRAQLEDVKVIKDAFGGTVNDVLLTCIAGGFRELLSHSGQPLPTALTVSTLIPVSVRTPEARGVLDNRVSAMIAELPVGLQDPVARLHALTAQLNERKRSGQELTGVKLTEIAGRCPPPLLSLGTRAFARTPQRRVHTVTTNVPGPQYPLYLCRRRMLEIFPYVPLALDVPLGIAICSYDGTIRFGITGDGALDRDVEILANGIKQTLNELLDRAQPPRQPSPRARPSARRPNPTPRPRSRQADRRRSAPRP